MQEQIEIGVCTPCDCHSSLRRLHSHPQIGHLNVVDSMAPKAPKPGIQGLPPPQRAVLSSLDSNIENSRERF